MHEESASLSGPGSSTGIVNDLQYSALSWFDLCTSKQPSIPNYCKVRHEGVEQVIKRVCSEHIR